MRILLYHFGSYIHQDVLSCLEQMGHQCKSILYKLDNPYQDEYFTAYMGRCLKENSFDCVFSTNFHPCWLKSAMTRTSNICPGPTTVPSPGSTWSTMPCPQIIFFYLTGPRQKRFKVSESTGSGIFLWLQIPVVSPGLPSQRRTGNGMPATSPSWGSSIPIL